MTADFAWLREAELWLERRGVMRGDRVTLEPLVGDVSLRRYVRVRSCSAAGAEATTILTVYPESVRDQARRFLRSGELLTAAGIRVPAVLDAEPDAGFVLLEDLGPSTLYDLNGVEAGSIAAWTDRAIEALEALRTVSIAAVRELNPPLDEPLFLRELVQTRRLLLEPGGMLADDTFAREVEAALAQLCGDLAAGPQVPCHRDYMARNLVPLASGELAVLDHQDLRCGPPAYDLASLLNDSVFAPAEQERRALDRWAPAGVQEIDYLRAVSQRGLKVAGTFIAFAERGSRRHLPLVRPSVDRALDAFARLPDIGSVGAALRHRWRTASATLPF